MPRRRMITDEETGERRPAAPIECPPDMHPLTWEWGKKLGNVSLAESLRQVVQGQRAPVNGEASNLLDAAMKLQNDATKSYVKLQTSIGRRLDESRRNMRDAQDIFGKVVLIQDDPNALLSNGQDDES